MGKTVPLLAAILFLAFFAGPAFARVNYVEFGGDDWQVSYQRETGGCYGYGCFRTGGYAPQYYPVHQMPVVPVTTYVPAYQYAYNTYLPYAYPYYYPYYAVYYYAYPAYYYPFNGCAATVTVN